MILDNYKQAISNIYEQLTELGINTDTLRIDHIGYQANSADDYDKRVHEISEIAVKLSENIVGGRRVGIFTLNEPLTYDAQQIRIMEIFEPREGQSVESAWEHIEFLTDTTLEDFISTYKEIEWDTSMMNREEFPMLILKLKDSLRAKFPRRGVEAEIHRQSQSK